MRDFLRILHALQVPIPICVPAADDDGHRRAVLPQGHAAYLRRTIRAASVPLRALLPCPKRERQAERDPRGRAYGRAHRDHCECTPPVDDAGAID